MEGERQMSVRVNLSVVIATLGGASVSRTIACLNCGSVKPAEILVCIPVEFADKVGYLADIPNVRIISTTCRGQVAQRAIGFQNATSDLVLQLDDDISLRTDCVEHLIACLMAAPYKAAVAPKMYDVTTRAYHAFLMPSAGTNWFQSFILWIVNGREGYQPGKIGRAGICMGVPEKPDDWFDVEWLPGGCVLHRKADLILLNYYPFKGKAFAEDLFHSLLLRQNGVHLVRCGSAACDVDFSSADKFRALGALKWYLKYTVALRAFMRKNGGSPLFLYTYLVVNLVGHITRKVINKSRSPIGR